MPTLFEFSRQINELQAKGKNTEALSYFRAHKGEFSNRQIQGNPYLVAAMLAALRKSNNLQAAFKFLEIYNIQIDQNSTERVLCAYGWLLYSKYKADHQQQIGNVPDEEELFDEEETASVTDLSYSKSEMLTKIEDLLKILDPKMSIYVQTVYSKLFTLVLKTEKQKPAPNWKLVNEFCDNFDPMQLSEQCDTIEVERKGQQREMELASDRETWFAAKSKALMKLGNYEECYQVSKQGLDSLEKFHFSNNVWFARRMTLSKRQQGDTEGTVKELRKILSKKKEWFIQKELAEILYENGQYEESLQFALQAINNFGDLEYKVELLFLLGKLHLEIDKKDLARQHFELSRQIRLENQWKIPQKLHDQLAQFPSDSAIDLKSLKSQLGKYWKQQNESAPQPKDKLLSGTIKTILNDNDKGKNGFIKSKEKDYYFTSPSTFHLTPNINRGSNVLFKVSHTPDGKKEIAKIVKLEPA